MALFGKSRFIKYINRSSFFEAFIEYMGDEDSYEEELRELKESRDDAAVEDFVSYINLWNKFRELVLVGEYEQAENTVKDSAYGNEMGPLEIKSVLNDLAEKTNDIHCYEFYWRMFGEDTIDEHAYALTLLTDVLAVCPQRKEPARMHLWWLIDNTEKKQKLQYAELGLQLYIQPNAFLTSMDVSRLIEIAREINPKSKEAAKTEFALYQNDCKSIDRIREDIQDANYEKACQALRDEGAQDDEIRRILMRGAYENKSDAEGFVQALRYVYENTKDPMDGFAVANAIWHCDLRKNEQVLNDSMRLSLSLLDQLENKERYMTAILDGLYLMEPYPLDDETAVQLAETVLKSDPDNEIAIECIAIADEQKAE